MTMTMQYSIPSLRLFQQSKLFLDLRFSHALYRRPQTFVYLSEQCCDMLVQSQRPGQAGLP